MSRDHDQDASDEAFVDQSRANRDAEREPVRTFQRGRYMRLRNAARLADVISSSVTDRRLR
jgi:hypothetical protein